MSDWWRDVLGRRPWWMNGLLFFCIYMALVHMPWDLFVKPVAEDEEAWFGLLLYGWAAKATEPIHWAIYAGGAYGFWRMRPWMWPWAAVYAAQLTIGMFLWPILYIGGTGAVITGVLCLVPYGLLTRALWRSRDLFARKPATVRDRYGEWAVITGASSGIGQAFARALAREGMSCALVARREDRLRELAGELERTYQVSTRVIAIDLAEQDGADQAAGAVRELDVGVLVNNAGLGYAGRFDKQDTERLRSMVQLNCLAPMVLTSHLLARMKRHGRGAIIITGSLAGHQPLPLHAAYSATKAFDLFFGEALWAELQGTGIDVLVLEPGETATEFQEVAGEIPHPGRPPEEVVECALEALGRQPSVIVGWWSWVRGNSCRFVPRSTTVLVAKGVVAGQTPEEMR